MKTLIFMLLISIFSSCKMSKHLTTGTYTIASKTGNVVTLKEVKGQFNIVSDTLKAGDKIVINVVRIHN